jgi:hypothetical protein
MEGLRIEGGKSSPEVDFDPDSGILRIAGESFPENAAKFYAPVMDWVARFLREGATPKATLMLQIVYFNSSTSKVLMNLFQLAEEARAGGREVSVRWICDAENETAIECGEEFREELRNLPFEIVVSGGA